MQKETGEFTLHQLIFS